MSGTYSEDSLLKDYRLLCDEYQIKAGKYIKELCKLQRMERRVTAEIRHIEWQRKREPQDDKIHCTFCGISQDDAKRIIAGPDVFICEECARLCVEILDDFQNESEGE